MRLDDLLIGLAIGDAFGAGVEFQDRHWIRAHVDFSTFVNARHQIQVPKEQRALFTQDYQAWDYTDDTEMTIGVLRALLSGEALTPALLVEHWKAEYDRGKAQKGYGRNGHGSMSWYYNGDKTIEEIRAFQRDRPNPGNAPAMRAVLFGLLAPEQINAYAAINALATHPNEQAVISSQCIARAAEYFLIKKGAPKNLFAYCEATVELNDSYQAYFAAVDQLPPYDALKEADFEVLCGPQPIKTPYFLSGICGVPSDSLYTTGSVLYVLKHSKTPFDALKKAVYLGGDVDSVASIVTGILAGAQGLSSLPAYMKAQVEGVDYLKALAQAYRHRVPL